MSDPQRSRLPKVSVPEPWSPADATDRFRAMAVDPLFEISFKLHAEDQMAERGITMPDVIFAMKHGFVYENAVPAMQPGLYRYTIRGGTPSSEQRDIKVVMIPSMHKASAKIVTVMWADEGPVRG
jgi:hypothetical protein